MHNIDVIFAIACFVTIVFLASLFDDAHGGYFNLFGAALSVPGSVSSFFILAGSGNYHPDDFWGILPAVTALLPTMCHVAILAFLLCVKSVESVIKQPLMLVVERLSEVKTGVITVLVGGACGLLKLMHLGLKAFS